MRVADSRTYQMDGLWLTMLIDLRICRLDERPVDLFVGWAISGGLGGWFVDLLSQPPARSKYQ